MVRCHKARKIEYKSDNYSAIYEMNIIELKERNIFANNVACVIKCQH